MRSALLALVACLCLAGSASAGLIHRPDIFDHCTRQPAALAAPAAPAEHRWGTDALIAAAGSLIGIAAGYGASYCQNAKSAK